MRRQPTRTVIFGVGFPEALHVEGGKLPKGILLALSRAVMMDGMVKRQLQLYATSVSLVGRFHISPR
jgi:hypothetical protein